MYKILIHNREITITRQEIEEMNYSFDDFYKILDIFQQMGIIQSYIKVPINPFI